MPSTVTPPSLALEVAMAKHAEVLDLSDEFIALARSTDVPIPTIDHLYTYLSPDAPQMPDGSAGI
jgi:hypothetical protein